jgi:hypothetical protein
LAWPARAATDRQVHPRSAAAEFPNDNPELHAGTIWRSDSPRGRVEAIAPEEPRHRPMAAPEPPPRDDFARLVELMVEVLLALGETRAAAEVTGLAAGRAPAALAALAQSAWAWRDVLAGRGDLSACGELALDEWAALILCTLLGATSRAPELRRALRARGVAAFGLIAQAA